VRVWQSESPRWIDRRALVLLLAESLAEHGGLPGFRDETALDAALARPRRLQAYEPKADLPRLAAAYGYGIVRGHPFNDENKRAGFLAIGLFLALNRHQMLVDQIDAVETFFSLAEGNLSESQLADWIREHTSANVSSKEHLLSVTPRLPPCPCVLCG
jgi:death on curing protein